MGIFINKVVEILTAGVNEFFRKFFFAYCFDDTFCNFCSQFVIVFSSGDHTAGSSDFGSSPKSSGSIGNCTAQFFQQFGHSFVGLCAGIDDHFNFIRNDIGGYAAAFDAGNFTGPGNDRIDFNSRNRIDSDSGCLDCVDTQVRTCAVTG